MAGGEHEWLDPRNKHDAEIRYLVEHTDLSPLQAKDLVTQHGTDRAKLLEIAKTMKAEG
jgi:Mg2+ and Co2+ transporter CorA